MMPTSSTTLPVLLFCAALMAGLGLFHLLRTRGALARWRPIGVVRPRRLTVEATTVIDARRRLHLVSCEGREVLLLTGGGADLVIGWLPPGTPEEVG